MKNLIKNLLIVSSLLAASAANADDNGRLFIIGDATPYGWELDMAQALMATPDNASLHTGTIYLKGGDSFKFMQNHEWGSQEYGIPAETAVDGEIQLATGTLDEGYSKMYVAQDGNYYITIDTETLKGNITRSQYQDSEIKYCSLFLIGDATDGGWTVNDGTPLYQSETAPYEYSAVVELKSAGSFKIATALRGAESWDAQYYYFRDADSDGKISTDSTDDRQWSVAEDGDYRVSVNTLANTISITKEDGSITGIVNAISADNNALPVYYNLQGSRVNNPSNGIFIKVTGDKAEKVIL